MKLAPIYFPLALDLDQPDRFSPVNAYASAVASQLAYDEANPQIVGLKTDTQAVLLDAGAAYVLAFRGTKPNAFVHRNSGVHGWLHVLWIKLRDFATDIDARRVTVSPGAKVHRGFYEALSEVWLQVVAATADLDKPLIITGHSLGAALAHLCAFRLAERGVAVHSVYAVACPNSCNTRQRGNYDRASAADGARLGEVTWNLWNEEDVVCRLPMLLTKGGQHAMFSSDGNLLFNPSLLLRLASDVQGLWEAWRRGDEDLVADHALERYIEKIKGKL